MVDVVSFRPSADEERLLRRTQEAHGFRTRAEALRFLLRKGAASAEKDGLRKFLAFRAPGLEAKSMTSREIDDLVYGDP